VLIWQHGKQSATITTFYKNLPMYTVIQQLILEIFKKKMKESDKKKVPAALQQSGMMTD